MFFNLRGEIIDIIILFHDIKHLPYSVNKKLVFLENKLGTWKLSKESNDLFTHHNQSDAVLLTIIIVLIILTVIENNISSLSPALNITL